MALLQKRSADLVGAFPDASPTAAAIDFGEHTMVIDFLVYPGTTATLVD
ncbi:hypothetical protein MTo_00132 [Microcystis aeruginosa NIES-1211]|jgi:hypothetical protein|nr:hypothetical protein MTo_00132 [Microcystis aeruginosa NIES-1211]